MVLTPHAPYYRDMPKKRPATNLAPVITPLGQFIREQRDARGWSQDDVASRAGANLTFTNISNIERGKTVLPDPPAMIGLARAFDIPVVELYAVAGYPEFTEWIGTISDEELHAWRQRLKQITDEARPTLSPSVR